MNRPYIFCHMMTSLDGKIMGNYMETPEGTAALNWSFIQAGMCDEVSVVIAAVADGAANTQTLFMTKEGLSNDTPVGFKLQEAKVMDGDSIWLRYLVKNAKGAMSYAGLNVRFNEEEQITSDAEIQKWAKQIVK